MEEENSDVHEEEEDNSVIFISECNHSHSSRRNTTSSEISSVEPSSSEQFSDENSSDNLSDSSSDIPTPVTSALRRLGLEIPDKYSRMIFGDPPGLSNSNTNQTIDQNSSDFREIPHMISEPFFEPTRYSNNVNIPPRPKTSADLQYDSDLQRAIQLSLMDFAETPQKPQDAPLSEFEKDINAALAESQKEAHDVQRFAEIIHNKKNLQKILSSLIPIVDVNDPRFKQFYQEPSNSPK